MAENKRRITSILSTSKCVDCGEIDAMVLDFDHVRGRKCTDVATLWDLESAGKE